VVCAVEHGELVAQNQDLDLLGRVGVGAQHDPAQELGEHLVDQPQRHQPIMPGTWRGRTSRSRAVRTVSGTRRDEHLHEMRKAAKRLRYAAEAIRPVRGRPAKRLVRQVKAVQELLGEHQDSVVARGLLRELGAAAPAEGGNGFAFGWLMRDEQARAERVEAQLDPTWAKLRRRARAVTG
jgi:CHAD domain-containing protein